jgi:type I restriction enzyme S subunit
MQATASEAEINKFSLKEGDVIITKDSETPEDIGIPAVVVEKLKGVICGYHLAIIRPDTDKINPVYLAKELTTLRIKKQFYKYANGATRFGLGTGDIGKIEIVVPKLDDQVKISRLFQSMDREASLFAMVREHWQSQKQGLMQKLLTGKIRVKDGAK